MCRSSRAAYRAVVSTIYHPPNSPTSTSQTVLLFFSSKISSLGTRTNYLEVPNTFQVIPFGTSNSGTSRPTARLSFLSIPLFPRPSSFSNQSLQPQHLLSKAVFLQSADLNPPFRTGQIKLVTSLSLHTSSLSLCLLHLNLTLVHLRQTSPPSRQPNPHSPYHHRLPLTTTTKHFVARSQVSSTIVPG